MAGDVTIHFDPPPSSLAALIDRIQRDTLMGIDDATRMAAYYLARSLGASTKSAPKQRRLRKQHGSRPEFPQWKYPYYVRVYDKDGRIYPYYLRQGTEKTHPKRTIKRRGLAKTSWLWMLGSLGRPQRAKHAPIPGATNVTKIGDKANPGWVLENKLRYIESAVRHSGKRAIETAFARAINAGNRALDRKMKKAKS